MPLRPGLSPLAAAPEFEDYVLTQLTHADHDPPNADVRHWTRLGVNWSAYYGRTADVPMLHVAGWYDPYCGSMFENFVGLSRAKTSPVHLLVGPWTHGANTRSYAGDVEFGPAVDVYPPSEDFPTGFEMNLTDGILRARYRNDPSRPEPMTPGEVYELAIEPYPTANRFKAGHRIRIDVSSSNFPRFDVNPNTGEPLGLHRRSVPADNSIHHDPAYPSHVVLPLVAVTPD